jgi:hypothetical protein
MTRLREMAPDLLMLVIAIGVPLAGLLLAVQVGLAGDRRQGLRIAAAAVLGVCAWVTLLTV